MSLLRDDGIGSSSSTPTHYSLIRPASALLSLCLLTLTSACSPAPEVRIPGPAPELKFDGQRALELERQFVTRFPNRHSGQPNNRAAVEWLKGRFETLGSTCQIDEWQIVNYSRPVDLQNLVCRLDGTSDHELVVVAHHDQSPDTVQGADNDGSGIAIMLHLAEILAADDEPRHDLVFLSSDAEEYGMVGARRFVTAHPDPGRIIAVLSLDNLGKSFYDGLEMEAVGQFRGYAPLWLQRLAQAAADWAGAEWVPQMRLGAMQALNQAVPVSFMDQGPFVAAGVPAVGFAGSVPPDAAELHWRTYHTPADRLEIQSAETLGWSGRTAEALLKSLLAKDGFPAESGPYLYFENPDRALRGAPLWTLFVAIVAIFVLGAVRAAPRKRAGPVGSWREALPHFLGLWLPLVGSVLLTYALVTVGLMQEFAVYPATAKDEPIFEPRWVAVGVFLIGLAALLWNGRWLASRYSRRAERPDFSERKSLALLAIGIVGLYLLLANPFSLLFLLPLFFWFGIRGREGRGRWLDLAFFLLGGILVYALIYFFGFVILRNGLAVLWYLLMMFSIGMISFPAALAITAALAAGLSLIVRPADAAD